MKTNKTVYWISTGILSLLFLFSATMYLVNYDMVEGFFDHLGFPTWLIYPLAILKILGIVAILTKKSIFLKELAYAGFLFDAILALAAHIIVKDGEFMLALIGCLTLMISWGYDRKVYGSYVQKVNE